MQYWGDEKGEEAGLKVMLDGQGGDELLRGYERYYIAYFLELFRTGRLRDLLREYVLAVRNSRMSFWWFLASVGYFACYPLRRSVLKRRSRFLKPEALARSYPLIRSLSRDFFRPRDLQVTEIMGRQLSHLLRYEDRNSMAFSSRPGFPHRGRLRPHGPGTCRLPRRSGGVHEVPVEKAGGGNPAGEIAWRATRSVSRRLGTLAGTSPGRVKDEIAGSAVLSRICRFRPDPEG